MGIIIRIATPLVVLGALVGFRPSVAQTVAPYSDGDFYKIARVEMKPIRPDQALLKRAAEIQEDTEVQSRSEDPDAWRFTDQDLFEQILKGQSKFDGASTIVVIDKIIQIGKAVWPIIEKNKPKANLKIDHLDIVPQGIGNWQQLEQWSAPKSRHYQVTYENVFGVTLAEFKFRVTFTPNGTYKGKGKYLSYVSALATDLYVFFGVEFNAKASIVNVVNAGTAENPVAAAQVQVEWSSDTIVVHDQGTHSVYVRGDGFARDL